VNLGGQRILITGGAGFIGSHLAERLAPDNFLRVVDDFSTGSTDNLDNLAARRGVEIIKADLCDPRVAHDACDGIDVVFHLAVSCLRTSLSRPHFSHDVNAGGTLNLCEAAHRFRIRRFIYISSSEVYGTAQRVPMNEDHPWEPLTVYGASKLAGELYAKAFFRTHGLPVVIVRPFNTYGPREPWEGRRAEVIPRFILRALAGQSPVIFGNGNQTRDFTYIDDTVSGIVLAAECDAMVGQAVNVAAGRECSIRAVAEAIAEKLELRRPVRCVDARPGDVTRHFADISKARRLFGFEPTVDLETGLDRCIERLRGFGVHDSALIEAAGAANW